MKGEKKKRRNGRMTGNKRRKMHRGVETVNVEKDDDKNIK